jgi:nitroreductase
MKNKKMPSHHGVKQKIKGTYPNETMRLLIERASCRNFSHKNIPSKKLHLILEAGVHSPTGGNLQPYSIVKIEHEKMKQKLAKMCYQKFIAEAAVDLLFCIDWRRLERWAKLEVAPFTAMSSFEHFWISFQDTIICAQNICTAADVMGLGSVYIGTVLAWFRELKKMFKLPHGVFPIVLLCIGYPKKRPTPRKKLDIDVVVHDETYHEITDEKLIKAFHDKYPHVKIEATDKRVREISEVCEKVHGKKFARQCVERIKENGYINMAQRYFGLHYRADWMTAGNEEFLKIMEEFGFRWFKKFRPPVRRGGK